MVFIKNEPVVIAENYVPFDNWRTICENDYYDSQLGEDSKTERLIIPIDCSFSIFQRFCIFLYLKILTASTALRALRRVIFAGHITS